MRFYPVAWVLISFGLASMGQTATPPAAGDGSALSPYQIASLDNLYWITQNASEWSAYFIQTAPIDAADSSTWPNGMPVIGDNTTNFTGHYDGQNQVIGNLYVNRSLGPGLFGFVAPGATIQGVHLRDCQIIGGTSSLCGSLIGSSRGTISNCSSTGAVSGGNYVGGFVGGLLAGSISDCWTKCTVDATDSGVGGFVGSVFSGSVVSRCVAKGAVQSTHSGSDDSMVGGFAGENSGSISYCYAKGTTSGKNAMGGFVGLNQGDITKCFSHGNFYGTGDNVGGFVGDNDGSISYCYSVNYNYVTGTSCEGAFAGRNGVSISDSVYFLDPTLPISGCGCNLGTFDALLVNSWALFEDQATYAGWDFTNDWALYSRVITDGYAHFQWENLTPPVAVAPAQAGAVYQIGSLDDLRWIAEHDSRWSYQYSQVADIDFASAIPPVEEWDEGKGWKHIGGSTHFTGSFDGQTYSIIGMRIINRDMSSLFGRVGPAGILEHLAVVDVWIDSSYNFSGAVCGENRGTVRECYASGTVSGKGLSGGLVGGNFGTVSDCYSRVNVRRSEGANEQIGGFIGHHGSGSISNCYSTGWVKDGAVNVGGGFAGSVDTGTFSSCYWDTQTSETSISAGTGVGVTGKTTAAMQTEDFVALWGWDAGIWERIGSNYPRLRDNPDSSLPVTLTSFSVE